MANTLAVPKISKKDYYFPFKILEEGIATVRLSFADNGKEIKDYLARGISVLAAMNTKVSSDSA